MPRKPGHWNNLPKAVYTGSEDVSAHEVLTAWGVADWGKEGRFFEGDFVGWCRVHLPDGWMISLEGYDFFLLDHHGQVRGEIYDAFERPERAAIVITKENIEAAGISKEEWEEAFPTDEERKEPEKPRMVLRAAIRFRSSFSLGKTHSYWVENPMGRHLFGVYDEPVSDEEYRDKIPRLEQRVFDWMDENYPDWRDLTAYWDTFVEMDKRWSISYQDIAAVADSFMADKSDEELCVLRAEMGDGEKYTDYLVALQPKLVGVFGQTDDIPPFYVASRVAWQMKIKIYQRTGLEYR